MTFLNVFLNPKSHTWSSVVAPKKSPEDFEWRSFAVSSELCKLIECI